MRVTVIGSGFAALAAIRKLRLLDSGRKLDISVVAPRAEFIYSPSLIWVPSGQRDRKGIAFPLQDYFRQMDVRYHPGEVKAIREHGRRVESSGGVVENDALLIACGADYMQKAPGIKRYAINPCSGYPAARAIRERVAKMDGGTIAMGFAGNPKEPTAVRGGPLFEFLFGMHTQLRREGRRKHFKLKFFTPMPQPGKRLGAKAVTGLLSAMNKRDIETHLGHKIVGFEADRIRTEGGDVASDLTVFLPGMTGRAWFSESDMELSPGGFFKADETCRAIGGRRVYVAGDAGSFPGPDWRAKQAHMAEIQAKTAASNLWAELHGREPSTGFRTELVCIVDTLDSGMMVSRFPKFNLMLPPLRLMHFVKKAIEWKCTIPYR
ncbi:MAG: FAD-dependent oxidoreductase [Magnetococcales bacterium]|nr:FAD-dependent oxidoreductase [Magnetococcales bacterium]